MNLLPIQSQNDLSEAARLFHQIDSSISFLFTINQDKAISSYLVKAPAAGCAGFDSRGIRQSLREASIPGSLLPWAYGSLPTEIKDVTVNGAFFCYKADTKAYLYISFDEETVSSSVLVSGLCHKCLSDLNGCPLEAWINYENKLTIQRLKQDFLCGDGYSMTEFVMDRPMYSEIPVPLEVSVKGFQPLHLWDYLHLLDTAMTYHDTIDFYSSRAEKYKTAFLEGHQKGFFKAFWIGGTLIGLYLRSGKSGDELTLLAIHDHYQRKGYGSMLLHHGAKALFESTDKNQMYLYCMDHNLKAYAFYLKQQMRVSGHSYKIKILSTKGE